jgi:hypothetical protein
LTASAAGCFFSANTVGVGEIRHTALDGTGLTTIVPNLGSTGWLAVDATNIYWYSGGAASPANLFAAALDGSNVQPLTRGTGAAAGFLMNDKLIYGADSPNGYIYSYCKAGQH